MSAGVYFIRATVSGLVKIGYSCDVARRIATLQTSAPEPLELLGILEGPPELERALHRAYDDERQRGEWFRMSTRLRALVEGTDEGLDLDAEWKAAVSRLHEAMERDGLMRQGKRCSKEVAE